MIVNLIYIYIFLLLLIIYFIIIFKIYKTNISYNISNLIIFIIKALVLLIFIKIHILKR